MNEKGRKAKIKRGMKVRITENRTQIQDDDLK